MLAAHARGDYAQWVRDFYGPGAVGTDALTGRKLPPVDPASFSVTEVLEDIENREDAVSRGVVRCPECGRLYVQREHGKNEYDCYTPEPQEQGSG